jgi:hypothetical protein
MEPKALTSNVITAVVTAGVLGVAGWALGVFSAGSNALEEEQIKAVIKEVLVRDNGATYAASLAGIDLSLASITTSIGAIKEDIDDLEGNVAILAAE